MKVLWKTSDGREFVIAGKDMKDIQEKIALKRQELELPAPDVMLAQTDNLDFLKGVNYINAQDLDEETKKNIVKAAQDVEEKVNSRKLN